MTLAIVERPSCRRYETILSSSPTLRIYKLGCSFLKIILGQSYIWSLSWNLDEWEDFFLRLRSRQCSLTFDMLKIIVMDKQSSLFDWSIGDNKKRFITLTFRCSTLGQASGLTNKHQTRLERLARDKHSSLSRKFVNYGRKKFYRIGPGDFVVKPSWN